MAAIAGAGIVAQTISSSSLKLRGREKFQRRKNMCRISCGYYTSSSSSTVMDPYRTLRVQRDASEFEVKKAFRDLAKQVFISILLVFSLWFFFLFSFCYYGTYFRFWLLVFSSISLLQYHPDVCRGNDCAVQFHEINEAYNVSPIFSDENVKSCSVGK